LEIWQPTVTGEGIDGLQIHRVIVGYVQQIGPLSDEILASFNSKKQRAASLTAQFPKETKLKIFRGQNERLMHIMEVPSSITTRNIQDFHIELQGGPRKGLRLFLESNFMARVIPPGTKVGDTIC